ncbi:MAG: hypothetical protein JW789_00320 [Candidatus Aenigmarchaeota archaeon]|nr:hypothetical protein [Candidatus Aenigmarchaeota archaeon]
MRQRKRVVTNSKSQMRLQERLAKKYCSLHHFIDVSGGPPQKTAFGLFSINRNSMNRVYKDFRKTFPRYVGKRAKASSLDEEELIKIIDFFNSNGIMMRASCVENGDWLFYKRTYEHRKKYFEERIYGMIYCTILKTVSYRDYPYPVIMCKERYLRRPETALDICKEFSNYSGYHFSLSFGDRKVTDELRFADFIAGSAFKINRKKLENFENFHFIDIKLPRIYCLKAFNYHKSEI